MVRRKTFAGRLYLPSIVVTLYAGSVIVSDEPLTGQSGTQAKEKQVRMATGSSIGYTGGTCDLTS
jgi:hypothetical protein